jgi:hypothetical protein
MRDIGRVICEKSPLHLTRRRQTHLGQALAEYTEYRDTVYLKACFLGCAADGHWSKTSATDGPCFPTTCRLSADQLPEPGTKLLGPQRRVDVLRLEHAYCVDGTYAVCSAPPSLHARGSWLAPRKPMSKNTARDPSIDFSRLVLTGPGISALCPTQQALISTACLDRRSTCRARAAVLNLPYRPSSPY